MNRATLTVFGDPATFGSACTVWPLAGRAGLPPTAFIFCIYIKLIAQPVMRIYNKPMGIAFDPDKDAMNREKHGVSLAFGAGIFADVDHIVVSSAREIDGEVRYKAVGMIDGKLWTAIHVVRGAVVRFISVRRSNDGEARLYNRP